MKCSKCGTETVKGTKFCQNCGAPVKKKKGWLIALCIVLSVVILLAAAAAVTFALLFKPKNLGVDTKPGDYEVFKEKLGMNDDELKIEGPVDMYSIVGVGEKRVNASFTSEEVTSYLCSGGFFSDAMTSAQAKCSDGFVEISGELNTKYILSIMPESVKSKIPGVFGDLSSLPDKFPVYVKLQVDITDNKASVLKIVELKILGINVMNYTDVLSFNPDMTTAFNANIGKQKEAMGLEIKRLYSVDGQLVFEGTIPESLSATVKKSAE